jgi:hypothetical protein
MIASIGGAIHATQVQLRSGVNQASLIGFRPRARKPEFKLIFHGIFTVSCGFCARAMTLIAVNA